MIKFKGVESNTSSVMESEKSKSLDGNFANNVRVVKPTSSKKYIPTIIQKLFKQRNKSHQNEINNQESKITVSPIRLDVSQKSAQPSKSSNLSQYRIDTSKYDSRLLAKLQTTPAEKKQSNVNPDQFIYTFVDPRTESGSLKSKVVSDIELDRFSPICTEEARAYLDSSSDGNSFCGVVNIKSGALSLYPLAPEREDATDSVWGKTYKGQTHDGGQPLKHAMRDADNNIVTSHDQLVEKLGGSREDYVGFSLNDLTDVRFRSAGGFLGAANHDTSVLYGRSRTLNTFHFKTVDDKAVSHDSTKDTFDKNNGELLFELPIEFKEKIINQIIKEVGKEHKFGKLLEHELKRDEMNKNFVTKKHFFV